MNEIRYYPGYHGNVVDGTTQNRERRNGGYQRGEGLMTNRLTLKQRREIVRRFMRGETALGIQQLLVRRCEYYPLIAEIEQVLRDYMHGRFTLEPKRKSK